MLEYNTTGIIRIHGGIIGLSKKQADARRACVRPVTGKKDLYEILTPIELKAGEIIRLAGPDKVLRRSLVLTPAEQARQEAKTETSKPAGKEKISTGKR